MNKKKIAVVCSPHIESLIVKKELSDKVIIVGAGKVEKSTLNKDVGLIINDNKSELIEVNGKFYLPVQIESDMDSSRGRMGKVMSAMAPYMLAMEANNNNGYKRQRPPVNIIEEFKLIQEKKSTLCRSDRDWVIKMFNTMYKLVDK